MHASPALDPADNAVNFDVQVDKRGVVSHHVSRRTVLRALGVTGLGAVAGGVLATGAGAATRTTVKKAAATTAAAKGTGTTSALTSAANCAVVPTETGGPFPGDGTNGANVLTQSGVVRSDVRSSFGTSTTTAKGVPLTLRLSVIDTAKSCGPLGGAAVYIWHCDANGNYSMYSDATVHENYLRGVQTTDSKGLVTFTSIFPAAYPGRWPHIHFEVYPNLAKATTAQNALKTSQLALPEAMCKLVYATSGYPGSADNLSQMSLNTDMVFSDGYSLQLATVTGDVRDGFVANLTFGV